jgi:hypothetical protein
MSEQQMYSIAREMNQGILKGERACEVLTDQLILAERNFSNAQDRSDFGGLEKYRLERAKIVKHQCAVMNVVLTHTLLQKLFAAAEADYKNDYERVVTATYHALRDPATFDVAEEIYNNFQQGKYIPGSPQLLKPHQMMVRARRFIESKIFDADEESTETGTP